MSQPALFVSHSHHDNPFCQRLVQYLREHLPQSDVFYDETELHGGDQWMVRLQAEVLARPFFIVILSPKSVTAPWVREETLLALNRAIERPKERWVIPVRLKKDADVDELAPLLASRQIISCVEDEEKGFAQIVEAITNLQQNRPAQPIWGQPRGSVRGETARRAAIAVHAAYRNQQWHQVIFIGDGRGGAVDNSDNDNDAELWGEVGHACLEVGRKQDDASKVKRAVELLSHATHVNPNRPDLWIWRAQGLAQLGDLNSAIESWRDAFLSTDADLGKIDIAVQMCAACNAMGDFDRAASFADLATEVLDDADFDESFTYDWAYWASLYEQLGIPERASYCHSKAQPMKLDDEDGNSSAGESNIASTSDAKRVFAALQEAVKYLRKHGQNTGFPNVALELQRNHIDYHSLGHKKFKDFIASAEHEGFVKVTWLRERSLLYLPTESVMLQPVGQTQKPNSALVTSMEVAAPLILAYLDALEKGLPYISIEQSITTMAKRFASLSPSDIRSVIDRWLNEGVLEAYETEPLFLDGQAHPRKVPAIRLNHDNAFVQKSLSRIYSTDTSSWSQLAAPQKWALVVTYRRHANAQPFVTWARLMWSLAKEHKGINWGYALASAVDEGVIHCSLHTVMDQTEGRWLSIKSLTLDMNHPSVQPALEAGA